MQIDAGQRSLPVGALCKEKSPRLWRGKQLLKIVKRYGPRDMNHEYQDYFVVAVDGEYGYGAKLHGSDLVPLSPLEILAAQAD